jgi:hypothetical protein
MDGLTFLIIGIGTYIGYKRGLVLEVTDWFIGFVAGFAAFRGFRPLGKTIFRFAPGWGEDGSMSVAFWFLLVFVGVAVLTAGLHIDRSTREFDRIPPEVRNYGGLVSAFVKSIVLCVLLAVYLPMSDGLAEAEKASLKRSGSATALRNISPPVAAIMGVIAPRDLAEKFQKAASR